MSTLAERGGFSHEALFYAGTRDFVEQIAAFVREGVAAGEPVLVMVRAEKIALLREALGAADADRVHFADMGAAGRNPGRIISAWTDFAAEHLRDGERARGVGEPIWAGRSDDEMVECQHHEQLLNMAFGDAHGFRLVCPYDTDALPADVIEEARRSHPVLVFGAEPLESSDYRGAEATPHATMALPPPRAESQELGFQGTTLDSLRAFVMEHALAAGFTTERAEELVVAVNEAATNSVRHGGGEGALRLWRDGDSVVCEVRDRGRIDQPLVGRRRPERSTTGGHGLWLAHQLCDLVQLRSRRGGTVVRLHMAAA
jgi:anti-sigma regulatory factor (Ser/Thr protein kinase)